VSFDQVVMDSVGHVTKLVGAAGNLFGPPPQSPAVSPTIDGGGSSNSGSGGATSPTYPLPPGHAPISTPPPPAAPPPPPAGPGPQNGGLPGGANQAGTTYNNGTAGVSAIDEKLAAKLKEIFAANQASYDRVMAILKEIEDKKTQMGHDALNSPAGLLTFQKFVDEKLAEVQKILADAHVDTATQSEVLKQLTDEYRTTGPKGDEHDGSNTGGNTGGDTGGSGGGSGGDTGGPVASGGDPGTTGTGPLDDPLAGLGPMGGGMMDPLSTLGPALQGLSSLPQMMSGMGGGGMPIGDVGSLLSSLGGGLAGAKDAGFNDKSDSPKPPDDGFKDDKGEQKKTDPDPEAGFKEKDPQQPAPATNPADPLAADPKKAETAAAAAAPQAAPGEPAQPDLTVTAGDTVFTAPDATTAAVMRDVVEKGMSPTAAYGAHNVQLPPPGTPVTAPVDPNLMKGGELAYFQAQEPILALGKGKIWLDGQVQPLSALTSRQDFLGWTQAPGAAARTTGTGAV
jgi:hypothetical protein